jgi:hypothetical protein
VSSNENPGGRWRTSRYSNGQAECVEVAQPRPGIIAVRDSKDPGGPRLAFGPGQWRAFAVRVKAGDSQA